MSNTPDLPPPVPPTVIPPVVATLDPDLANAYLAGVPGVVQAVANGMTTNAMIVNDLIRTGASMAGMPSAIVQMVSERQKEIDAQRERVGKLVASAVGLGLMAASIPAAAEDAATSSSATADRDMWRNVSSAELAQMSYAQWSGLTEGQKKGLIDETVDRADGAMTKAGGCLREVVDKITADSKEKNLSTDATNDRIRNILTAVTQPWNDQGLDLKTPEGRAGAQANIDKLPPEDRQLAQEALSAYTSVSHADAARTDASTAARPETDDRSKHANVTSAHGHIAKVEQNVVSLHAAPDVSTAAPIAADTDREKLEGARLANDGEQQRLNAARLAEQSAGATVDTQVAKAELQTARPDDYGNEDTAPRKPSIVASNLGNGPDSRLAQLGAPAEAANDPKAPVAEPERPRVASLSQGMGA